MDKMNIKVNGVIYGKFNNRDKRGSLLHASSKGVVVIDKPFKEILQAQLDKDNVNVVKEPIIDQSNQLEITLLWQDAIHANYLRYRRGFR